VKQTIPKNQLKFYVSAIVNETFPAEPFDIHAFVAEVKEMGGDLKIVALMMGASDRSVMNWLNKGNQPNLVHREVGGLMLREIKKSYSAKRSLINLVIEAQNQLFPISKTPFNLQQFVWAIQDIGGSYDIVCDLMRCSPRMLHYWMSSGCSSATHIQIGVFLKSKLDERLFQDQSLAA
jgi:hypothetical protein